MYNPNRDGIAYIIHVIEYQVYNYSYKYIYFLLYKQYRGFPHAHIVYRYTTCPDRGNKEDVIKFMNSLITARFPDPIGIDASDAQKA